MLYGFIGLYLIKALLNANKKNRYMVVLFTLLKYCILLPNGGLLEVNVAMKYIIYNKFPLHWVLVKKSRLSAIDKVRPPMWFYKSYR